MVDRSTYHRHGPWECGSCGYGNENPYRCNECGHDMTKDSTSK